MHFPLDIFFPHPHTHAHTHLLPLPLVRLLLLHVRTLRLLRTFRGKAFLTLSYQPTGNT